MVGGIGVGRIRDEGCLVRFYLAYNLHISAGKGVSFDIELDGNYFGQVEDVVEADVSLVRAWVDGDSVGAGFDDGAGGVFDAGYADVPLVSQQRDFVEIDAQFSHLAILENGGNYIMVIIYSKGIRL